MTKIKEIIRSLEEIAPLSYQEDYDNSGLITGNAEAEVTGVVLSLDCLEAVVEEAIEKSCNVILCHHPIIFSGLKSLTGKNYVERTIIKAIKHDIAIIAWHTNLDNVIKGGVNHKIAEKLGLQNLKVLSPKSGTLLKLVTYVPSGHLDEVKGALFRAGAGEIGDYAECSFATLGTGTFNPNENSNPTIGEKGILKQVEESRLEVLVNKPLLNAVLSALKKAHTYEEVAYEVYAILNENQDVGSGAIGDLPNEVSKKDFLKLLKTQFGLNLVKYTNTNSETIKKVAVCGGSGSFLMRAAVARKADAYVTADIKYHEFFDADNKLMLCDIGHYESEIFTLELFYDVLSKKFSSFATLFTSIRTNPVNYYI